jgi:selenocysteine lyase/cysteine desulfurase
MSGALRSEFPVLDRFAYLNAGTDGPLPARALLAARTELEREVTDGRSSTHFQRRTQLSDCLRAGYAHFLGCGPHEVALTTCTTEGISIVVQGLGLSAGDEILTSDEEHPGLLGALQAARDLRGVAVRCVPLGELADSVGVRTRLIACSHVSWMSGRLAPGALSELSVPVLLDGAQAAGAIELDVKALDCDAYAGSGQKWLCGPDGTGMLYLKPDLLERLEVHRRGYLNFADAGPGLDAPCIRMRGAWTPRP